MLRGSSNIVAWILLITALALGLLLARVNDAWVFFWLSLPLGLIAAASPRQMDSWQRGVLLRLGQFKYIVHPGVTWVVPGLDRIVETVDMRIRSTPFRAEKTLTRDTVPVDVDAVLFWVVNDAERAVLEVEHFEETVSWAAQTTLRDVIGQAELVRMIGDRQALDDELQSIIDAKTSDWGITVRSVEIRDVRIPTALEDAMSRKAQADREREARLILAKSETLVAKEMEIASRVYAENPTALQIRAMNMTYASIKENNTLMVIPSSLVGSLDPIALGAAIGGLPRSGTLNKVDPGVAK